MSLSILVLCVISLMHIIVATNDTNILVTGVNIATNYDTLYEIFINYKYDGIISKTVKHNLELQNIFTASTLHAFEQFHLTIINPTYCVLFGEHYNGTNTCTYYTNKRDLVKHGAYGIFVGKEPNQNDYNLHDIVRHHSFVTNLEKHIANLIHSKSFSIIHVDISVIDPIFKHTQNPTQLQTIQQINDILHTAISIALYLCLTLCVLFILLMAASKLYGIYVNRDDIHFFYFIYFTVFSLNFIAHSMMFTLRLFEEKRFILGSAAFIVCAIRLRFDVSTTIHSKAIWTKSAFINKRVNEWLNSYRCMFIALSLISGPVGAITFVNSRLFISNIFFMDIPQSLVISFIGSILYNILFLQKLPELVIQIVFVAMNGYDFHALCAFITTISCIVVLLIMNHWMAQQHKDFSSNRSAFLMEISSEEINNNATKYLLRPNILRQAIADILDIHKNKIELLSFEAINVKTEINLNYNNCNNKVSRCYGLKMHIALNSNCMLRRCALMKLEKAKENETLMRKLKVGWNLDELPSIDDIVLVYDLSGDLVIQRAHSWSEATNSESIKLREIQENNLKFIMDETHERREYISEMQREMEQILEIKVENTESKEGNSCITHHRETNNPFDIYWDQCRTKIKVPSKMHVPDASILSMEFPFDDEIPDSLTVQMQRVTSDSSINTLVSV